MGAKRREKLMIPNFISIGINFCNDTYSVIIYS